MFLLLFVFLYDCPFERRGVQERPGALSHQASTDAPPGIVLHGYGGNR